MAKEKQILVYKNSYWLSEIGALFFKYQVGYEVYDYSENASMVDDGIDLMVLNSQNIHESLFLRNRPLFTVFNMLRIIF